MAVLFALWATTLAVAHLFAVGCLLHLLRRARPDLFDRLQRTRRSDFTLPAPLRQLSIDKGTPAEEDGCLTDAGALPHAEKAALPDALVLRKATAATHLQLEWRDLGCAVRTGTGGASAGVLHVLRGIWGCAQSGEMQALVGPSGAGEHHKPAQCR